MSRAETGFVSGGRNPNCDATCGFPRCRHLIKERDGTSVGWCSLPDNRVPPCNGWPTGFTPSVCMYTGGCNKHEAVPREWAQGKDGEG
jgi:hypothetical protein